MFVNATFKCKNSNVRNFLPQVIFQDQEHEHVIVGKKIDY